MNYIALKAELLAGHPDTGAYNVDNQLAADELNAINRPANGGIDGMVTYMVTNRNRTNDGNDTKVTTLMGRLKHVAESNVGDDPFDRGVGFEIDLEQKNAAQMFVAVLENSQLNTLDFEDTEIDVAYTALNSAASHAGVWTPADITALKGLSQNQQSRASEISAVIEYNRKITVSHVSYARSI